MLSVVIPTHQRRDRLLRTLDALARRGPPGTDVEVIVVVDGSTDGTVDAVARLDAGLTVRVLQQPRGGQAAARNRGARAARGDLLLFLDDDMECEPGYLAEVVDGFEDGADVVFTRMRLGSWVPAGALRDEFAAWLDQVHRELADGAPSVHNIMSGALAIRRTMFEHVGGFGEAFAAGTAYGAHDAELGQRLLAAGAVFAYRPGAVVYTECDTDPRAVLERDRKVGRSHVRLARTHPELLDTLLGTPYRHSRLHRAVGPVVRAAPASAALGTLLKPLAVAALRRARPGHPLPRLWRLARAAAYWRGVTEAGGAALARQALTGSEDNARLPRRSGSIRVLAYHSIGEGEGTTLAEYTVSPRQLREHLDALERRRVRWLSLDDLLGVLDGRRAPRRGVLLTFDDGYRDNAEAFDELARRGIPAVLFVVSGFLGETSSWSAGGARLPLLDAEDLQALSNSAVHIGSHSRSHTDLTLVAADALEQEVAGSAADLTGAGLAPPRVFAYPYGRHDERARASVRAAGYRAAFTVEPGALRRGTDPWRIPRIEIHNQDQGRRFLLKIATAGRSPDWEAWAHRRLRWAKPAWRAVRRLRPGSSRHVPAAAPGSQDGDDGARPPLRSQESAHHP